MALNKDVLGQARYNASLPFMDKTITELETTYGSLANARLEAIKADSDAIINHFKASSVLTIPALGFISASPGSPVTGTSVTGTIG